MEELIVKYLTDKLTSDEEARFRAMLNSEADFGVEFKECLAALALADLSINGVKPEDEAVMRQKLAEIIRHGGES